MPTLDWDLIKDEFEFDGSWRDIYVLNTTLADWQHMLSTLGKSSYEWGVYQDGVLLEKTETTLLILASKLFPIPQECRPYLFAIFAGVQANCHFFGPDEIEFDIDPRQVIGQAEVDAVFAFMIFLANATDKPVVLTPENMSDKVIFRISPRGTQIEHFPF
jgi:hypothetical protein